MLCPAVSKAALPALLLALFACHPSRTWDTWQCPVPGTVNDLWAQGSMLYVAAGESGLVVLDLSVPTVPERVACVPLPGVARSVTGDAHFAYVGFDDGRMATVSVDSFTYAVHDLGTPNLPVMRLICDGSLYFLNVQSAAVYDVTDPWHPALLARVYPQGYCVDMARPDYRIFVATEYGAQYWYIVRPDSLVPGLYRVTNGCVGLTVAGGGFGFFAERTAVEWFGVPNMSSFYFRARLDSVRTALDVEASPLVEYIYVSDSVGLTVAEVDQDGYKLDFLHHYDLDGITRHAVMSGDYVYTASGTGGVWIVQTEESR